MAAEELDLPPLRDVFIPSSEAVTRSLPRRVFNPQEMDGPDDLKRVTPAEVRARIPKAAWPANDSDAPDYAHLLPEGRESGGRRQESCDRPGRSRAADPGQCVRCRKAIRTLWCSLCAARD